VDSLFPDIVRQLFVTDSKVKRLAHICLKLFADRHPDIVLLCVNAIQRDCADMDALTRGVSLRTQCTIKHKEVSEGAIQALQKGSVDSSVYVRKCAAISAACLFLRSPGRIMNETEEMITIFERLLGDSEPTVLSTTLMSLWLLVRGSDSLIKLMIERIHPVFRRILRMLPDLDWIGQTFGIELLGEYCSRNFVLHSTNEDYIEFVRTVEEISRFTTNVCVLQTCLRILEDLGEARHSELSVINRLYHTPTELQGQLLLNLGSTKRIKPFLINTISDRYSTRLEKIEILTLSVNLRNASFLLGETIEYIKSSNPEEEEFIRKSISLIVKIGELGDSDLHDACLRSLIGMIDSVSSVVSDEAVLAVRRLIRNHSLNSDNSSVLKKTCIYLSSIIETVSSSHAKAAALWLINLCHDTVPIVAPNVLRTVARTIEFEDASVKLELSILAVKVLAYHELNIQQKSQKAAVPRNVSEKLIGPLNDLVVYILQVCSKDPLIGGLVRVLSSRKFPIVIHEKQIVSIKSEVVEPDARASRPIEDTPNSLRTPKDGRRNDGHEGKSLASDQSSSQRMFKQFILYPCTVPRCLFDRYGSNNDEASGPQGGTNFRRSRFVFHFLYNV
jgi:vesicle coat complex subunit